MSILIKLTNNSFSTIIAWLSTCLLAGGLSTMISESARMTWMLWGSFGLAAAIGLEVAARIRARSWTEKLSLDCARRFEREMKYEADDNEANVAIREAVARILGLSAPQIAASRRAKVRYPCDLNVELLLQQGFNADAGGHGTRIHVARMTNLSETGFELTLTESLPHRRMPMTIVTPNGGRQKMFGEVLWCSPQPDGSIVAGGRFLDAAPVEEA